MGQNCYHNIVSKMPDHFVIQIILSKLNSKYSQLVLICFVVVAWLEIDSARGTSFP